MNDELTKVDIDKMKEEIRYRKEVLGPQLGAELRRTREYGDLSENAEYKEAKREKRRNDGRIRYLTAMINTAHVLDLPETDADAVGLFDRVTFRNEAKGTDRTVQIVTTLRQNASLGFISKESPFGKALLGKRIGERATVETPSGTSYDVTVLAIEKGEDNTDLPISSY